MRALGGATRLWASTPSYGIGQSFGNAMEAVMETIALERAATSAPVKSRLQFGRRHLALAGLALALTLGGLGYSRYWWNVGRFIEALTTPTPAATSPPSRRMLRASLHKFS